MRQGRRYPHTAGQERSDSYPTSLFPLAYYA
nr:MAG TPA: hypothetical protein [Podoviridae sp. ctfN46]